MARESSRYPRISTIVVLMGVLAVLFIVATFSSMAWQRRAGLLHDSQAGNERLADTLAEHMNGVFHQSSLVLALVGERLDRERGIRSHDPAFHTFLGTVAQQAPLVTAIRVVTPDGQYLHSHPERPPEGVQVADRDYILAHVQGDAGLFIGRPIVSRVNGERVLPVSRAHRGPDGRLVAVVAVMIRLSQIDNLFESIRNKPNGTIALFSAEGIMLGRGPANPSLMGKDFSQGGLFREYLPNAAMGSYTAVVATDGKKRQASYRRLSGFPAVVSVSTLYDDTMAEWHRDTRGLALIALPLILASAAITWALHRQVLARERFERLLARRTADLELANDELRYMAEISAHHLQEPLRTVVSYAQLLVRSAQGAENPQQIEYLEFIRKGVDRMKAQLDALQRYLGMGECRPHQSVPLSRMLAGTTSLLAPRLAAQGARVVAGELPSVMGDPQHLSGLFHHLVSALLERNRPGTRQTIRFDAALDGEHWHLTVTADNTDIDFGESETIFPLLQAGTATEGGRSSTLSLALCRKIVQMHGGNMRAETTGDGQSRLHVLLPAQAA
jgi:signal transduction histidine kinase